MKSAKRARNLWLVPAVFGLVVLALWGFPALWYTQAGSGERVWFAERMEVPGWTFEEVPISEAAERMLVADRTVNGEFRDGSGGAVRVFSAKRYVEDPNEIGLFVHTPDRCWTEGGWRIVPIEPQVEELTLHGTRLVVERRLFQLGGNKELVYFCGLVDGQVLPYRLDHNLSAGARRAMKSSEATRGMVRRASDGHFWSRLWSTFESRRRLAGAKQFIRISTPVRGEDLGAGDERLKGFLAEWLVPGNYGEELERLNALVKK